MKFKSQAEIKTKLVDSLTTGKGIWRKSNEGLIYGYFLTGKKNSYTVNCFRRNKWQDVRVNFYCQEINELARVLWKERKNILVNF